MFEMPKLTARSIANMTDEQAYETFCRLRWPNEDVCCPKCGTCNPYDLSRSRKGVWRCRKTSCQWQFSVTSATIFAHRKLSHKDILQGIALFSAAAKGISACNVSRYLGVEYKTAFILCHKLREAVQRLNLTLNGIIEVDGCTIGGHRVNSNAAGDFEFPGRRADRRRAYRNEFAERRVLVGIREKHADDMAGPGRTRCFVHRKESEALPDVQAFVAEGATIHADCAHAWSGLKKLFRLMHVNHSAAYVGNDGTHTNNIESFWSLLRKMHYGVHHHINAENLEAYSNELCWRQDNRKLSEADKIAMILSLALSLPPSEKWARYWQGNTQRKRTAKVRTAEHTPLPQEVQEQRETAGGAGGLAVTVARSAGFAAEQMRALASSSANDQATDREATAKRRRPSRAAA